MLQALPGLSTSTSIPRKRPSKGITQRRSANNRFPIPEPGIVITREHISNALERKRFGLYQSATSSTGPQSSCSTMPTSSIPATKT